MDPHHNARVRRQRPPQPSSGSVLQRPLFRDVLFGPEREEQEAAHRRRILELARRCYPHVG
jgi:hypothetical protein